MRRFVPSSVVVFALLVSSVAVADDSKTSLPFGSSLYDLSRLLPHMKQTRLDVRITGGAPRIHAVTETRIVGPQAILSLPVRIENRSERTIAAYVANEWHGGIWPPTDLYAAVRKSGDPNARWSSHEIYVAGETGQVKAYTWKSRDAQEFSLRLNWPGTGSQHGGAFLSENAPGTYAVKIFLIFRSPSNYGFEYAESPEIEVDVEQTPTPK